MVHRIKEMLKMENIRVEDARIMFRNFAGEEGKFNPAGRRTFVVLFEPAVGTQLEKDGWNVKWLDPTDEYEEATPYIQVRVNYNVPSARLKPRVVLITSRGQTLLDETTIGMLDWADIAMVDLIIRPYHWEVNGKEGISAYVQSMYVTIEEDEFAIKYSDIDMADGDPLIPNEEEEVDA